MTKSAQLDAEIAESIRAREWQEQVEREDRERRARVTATGPTPEQLYEEYLADVASGVTHGERRGRAKSFRKIASASEALRASETAKQKSDDAYSAFDHREAADAHRRAAKLHKSGLTGGETGWLHDLAASNHRQAARARASKLLSKSDLTKPKTLAAFQEKLREAKDHEAMAQEYARQALAAAKKRS